MSGPPPRPNERDQNVLTRKEMVGPWAGLPVAWKDNGATFDEQVYRREVAKTCKAGVPGVLPRPERRASFYAMEMDEWRAIARATVEECRDQGTPSMIGVTATYTLGAQRRAAYAAELGADAIQLAVPYWMEVDAREIVKFFKDVVSAAPDLTMTIYETPAEQNKPHRRAASCNFQCGRDLRSGQVKCRNRRHIRRGLRGVERIRQRLGRRTRMVPASVPHGAIGCASALVYMNPRYILRMFDLLQNKQWDELAACCAVVDRLGEKGLAPFTEKGFTDTAYDHLQGLVAGFLDMSPQSRGPYVSCTDEDVKQLRSWMEANVPELLKQ